MNCFRCQRKCDQYWPSEGEQIYGQFNVRLTSVHVSGHYTVRMFAMRQCREKGTSILRVGGGSCRDWLLGVRYKYSPGRWWFLSGLVTWSQVQVFSG